MPLTTVAGAKGSPLQVAVTGWIWVPAELWLIALALGVGVFAELLPAWGAYLPH